ncbi:MAG: pilus assembly protein [Thioalkalivibrionaceae bacterium]
MTSKFGVRHDRKILFDAATDQVSQSASTHRVAAMNPPMMRRNRLIPLVLMVFAAGTLAPAASNADDVPLAQTPLFLVPSASPIAMLNLSVDHQLFFEAYPDYADLTGNGAAERTYNHEIDYYGYFDHTKCYDYESGRFEPKGITANKYCDGVSGSWSGNFLNWSTMSRIDVVRRILYGGFRSTDTASETVLERAYLPNDAHSFVRFYNGADVDRLTPFSMPEASTSTSSTSRAVVVTGSRTGDSERRSFVTGWRGSDVQIGDQMTIRSTFAGALIEMQGVVLSFNRSNGEVTLQITQGTGTAVPNLLNSWTLINHSRAGLTFCNTTVAASGYSQNITAPPLLRVARGDYSLWTANERWQCRWSEEKALTGHPAMTVGNRRMSNGNIRSITRLSANAENPRRADVAPAGAPDEGFHVRVSACVSEELIGDEPCQSYGEGSARVFKPTGLLQTYADRINFGLLTGSYGRSNSGGVLRRNVGDISDEINPSTGQFALAPGAESIIRNLDALRVFGYNHNSGVYNDNNPGDNCAWALVDPAETRCSNWGNPQSEQFLESLRYLAGAASGQFVPANDRLAALTSATWKDPLSEDNFCAPLNILSFNSSVASYDTDAFAGAADLPGFGSVATWTNKVGEGEGIHGTLRYVGRVGDTGDQHCTPKTVTALADAHGLCPEAPRLQGGFHVAGLAHYAWTRDIRPTLPGVQNVKTFGVALAPAVPRIEVPRPGEVNPSVQILPACNEPSRGRCAIVDFRIVEQDLDAGTGRFFVQWEDSEQGGDYDMDMNGILSYRFVGAGNQIEVTTQTFAESTSASMGFGYVITGTTNDGFKVHSGVNNYTGQDCSNCNVNDPATTRTYTLGASSALPLENPLWYAAKWGGFDRDLGDQPTDQQAWDTTGDGRPDNYYFAVDPRRLADDLAAVFDQLSQEEGSFTALSQNSTRADIGTALFQARFDSRDWSGEIRAYEVQPDGTLGGIKWTTRQAGRIPPAASRTIVTHNGVNALPFSLANWSQLSEVQRQALIAGDDEATGQQRLQWLRGEAVTGMRERSTPLGDIINSDPLYEHGGDFGFARLPEPEGETYPAFLTAQRARREMLYVGANDGMLHGFDAATGDLRFSYLPGSNFAHLADLTSTNYTHRYFVDGSPRIVHARIDNQWRTVLVGTTGAGGKTLFALDVTDPDGFGPDSVLWEVAGGELGSILGSPTIARLNNGDWVVIAANGFNTPDGRAKLLVYDLATGDLLRAIDTKAGNTMTQWNGLGPVTPVSITNNGITDFVYAGDFLGNLWKFDLTGENPPEWGVALGTAETPVPLFVARDADGNRQPITVRPEVVRHPEEGRVVLFGTGSYFRAGDDVVGASPQIQTFYGIFDRGSALSGRSQLRQQTILNEQVGSFELPDGTIRTRRVRVSSDERLRATDEGWFIDLSFNGIRTSERVVRDAVFRSGRVFFSTLIPDPSQCSAGGTGWTMGLNALTGQTSVVFDLNQDRQFDEGDQVTVDGKKLSPSGIAPESGIPGRPSFVESDDGTRIQIPTTSGEIENEGVEDGALRGRQSWQQLR